MAAPPTLSAPSTSTPTTSVRGVTLDTIMAQLQRMDACLDTLSTELYQVNTHGSPWWFCGVSLSSSRGTRGIQGR